MFRVAETSNKLDFDTIFCHWIPHTISRICECLKIDIFVLTLVQSVSSYSGKYSHAISCARVGWCPVLQTFSASSCRGWMLCSHAVFIHMALVNPSTNHTGNSGRSRSVSNFLSQHWPHGGKVSWSYWFMLSAFVLPYGGKKGAMLCSVVLYVDTSISMEHAFSIFRVEMSRLGYGYVSRLQA